MSAEKLRYITWNGDEDDYVEWREKFMLHCKIKGVADGFLLNEADWPVAPLDNTDDKLTAAYETKLEEFKKKNGSSFTELLLSIESTNKRGKIAYGHAKASKTNKFPNGSARKALQNLDERYDTMDKDDCQDLLKVWSNLKLTNQNPADFITELEDVQSRLKSRHGIKKEDNELMLQALIAIENEDYKVDKTILNKHYNDGKLTIRELKKTLKSTYKERAENKNVNNELNMGFT